MRCGARLRGAVAAPAALDGAGRLLRVCIWIGCPPSVLAKHRIRRRDPHWCRPALRSPGELIRRRGLGAARDWGTGEHMRILLISSAYNSMTQRVHVELADRGHCVSVELALSDEVMRDAVRRDDPDLVIAPMLTTAIPADIWSARPCFIVHPGPTGDRGPSSLDWAIMSGTGRWGVTVLQANAEMDAGDIWSTVEFPVPRYSKSSLYRPRWQTRHWMLCCWRLRASKKAATSRSHWTTAVPASPARYVPHAGRRTAGLTGRPNPPLRFWRSSGRPIPGPVFWT